MSFPKEFIWGAASAAYQIEGGAFEDGKGASIWDQFSHQPGKVHGGHTGDIAADTYHRFEADLDLMVGLGIRNYRFSISWPRVFPEGETGTLSENGTPSGLNLKGIDYYDRLVDGCLSRGIVPWVTLYHWDLPLALFQKGGWLSRNTALCFGDYAAYIARHFKGRVRSYITLNEPQCSIGLGHVTTVHAPGIQYSCSEQFTSWHNIMLAHGLAVRSIRENDPDAAVGFASTGHLAYIHEHPEETPDDLVRTSFVTPPPEDNPEYFFNHHWFLDPVFKGHYPDDPDHPWTPFIKDAAAEDMAVISSPVDFAGLNIYNGIELVPGETGYVRAEKYPGYPRNSLKWPVTPEILYWGPRLIYERYGKEMYILENGVSCNDRIFLDGKVHDPDRIDFLHRYIGELKECCGDGVPVKGYFQWSLTDNFEWHSGYDDRFGLIYIDYRDQRRIPKDSAAWYAEVIKTNGSSL